MSQQIPTIFIFLFAHTYWAVAEDPAWFPDLTCHPGAQENSFGDGRKGINYFREKAKTCKLDEKGQFCLKACVMEEMGIAQYDRDGSYVSYKDYNSDNVNIFINEITDNTDYAKNLSTAMVYGCKAYTEGGYRFKGEYKDLTCENAPFFVECLEAYLNCSRKPHESFLPPKHFDMRCHPKFDWKLLFEIPQEIIRAQMQCMHFKDDEFCSLVCLTILYEELRMAVGSYRRGVKKQESNETLEHSIQNLAMRIPGFLRVYDHETEQMNLGAARDVAAKIAENCSPHLPNIETYEERDDCPENHDKWKPWVDCLNDIIVSYKIPEPMAEIKEPKFL